MARSSRARSRLPQGAVDVPVSCACGSVRGVVRDVTWANARRLCCLCDDCQIYARYLGRARDLLDAHGGTELSYATQDRVVIGAGHEHLAAVRLYASGVLRVYASCCNTPVAHVPSPKLAFVGIPRAFMRRGPNGESRDQLLGPLVWRFQARFAQGEPPPGAHLGTPSGPAAAALLRVAWDTLRGRQRPSAFHDVAGVPRMPLTLLSATELEQLRGASAAASPAAESSAARRGLPQGCS